jgi:hypothetical protein
MPHNSAAAVVASRREGMDGTFEAVEDVPSAGNGYFKGLVVLITANFAGTHSFTSEV